MNLHPGEHEIIKDIGQMQPLKIVVSVKKDTIAAVEQCPKGICLELLVLPEAERRGGSGVRCSTAAFSPSEARGECSHNELSLEERREKMKVHYDKEIDAVYIKLGNQKPDGVIEISEGVNLDTTSEDKIVGIVNSSCL